MTISWRIIWKILPQAAVVGVLELVIVMTFFPLQGPSQSPARVLANPPTDRQVSPPLRKQYVWQVWTL